MVERGIADEGPREGLGRPDERLTLWILQMVFNVLSKTGEKINDIQGKRHQGNQQHEVDDVFLWARGSNPPRCGRGLICKWKPHSG